MSRYQPGHCNIGRARRVRRAAVSAAAFVVAGGYVVAYATGLLPRAALLGVFVPLAVGFEWGLQAYRAFCVRLAVLGQYAFGSDDGSVGDAGNRRVDRVAAAKITVVGIALAAASTLVLSFVL